MHWIFVDLFKACLHYTI